MPSAGCLVDVNLELSAASAPRAARVPTHRAAVIDPALLVLRFLVMRRRRAALVPRGF